MNCIWETVLKAKRSVYKLEELRFINSKSPGPYTESSFDFLKYIEEERLVDYFDVEEISWPG